MTKPKKQRELSAEKLAELAKAGVEKKSPLSLMELEVEETKRKLGPRKLASLPPEDDRPKRPSCRTDGPPAERSGRLSFCMPNRDCWPREERTVRSGRRGA